MENMNQDAHHRRRHLGSAPPFTIAVVAILALGVGAFATISSVANAAVLQAVATQGDLRAHIPRGTEITIDGYMGPGEWDDALDVEFSGGEMLRLKQDGRFLYLYIKGETPGTASLGIHSGDTIQILHASAGLITAKYVPDGDRWRQVEPFRSDRQMEARDQASDMARMQMNLDLYGWCALLRPRVIPDAFDWNLGMEYKISLELLENGESSLSVVLFQRTATQPLAFSPPDLADDSLSGSLVSGSNHEYLSFRPETWLLLSW
jgi:hypothetical protein